MKKYLLLLFTLMFAVSCSDDSSSSTPAPTPSKDPAQEVELIQRFNLDSYPADLSPFVPIPANPADENIFAKIPSISYGLVNETGKEYPNPKLELTAKNQGDKDKFTPNIYLGSYIPQLSYPVISIKSKSSTIEQIPLILTLKSEGTEVRKWEITLNSVYALQPTERIENAGTIQYNGIDKKIEMKLNETKRVYLYNSTASTLKINKVEWKLNNNYFQLQYDKQTDDEGYSNCYKNETTPNSIPSSSACFIDVKHVGVSHAQTEDLLTITPMIRDLSDTATFYKPSTIDFNYEVITTGQ